MRRLSLQVLIHGKAWPALLVTRSLAASLSCHALPSGQPLPDASSGDYPLITSLQYWHSRQQSVPFYVGNLEGVGRIYQQTFVDTYPKVAHCKLYVTKTPITAADLLNDRVLPFYGSQGLPMLRILTDRGTEFCGKVEQHDYQLYLAINDIDHTKTKAMSPQTNGICERFHKTILNEFYQVTFRKKLYGDLDSLQSDLDEWLAYYNNERTHQGKMCCGRTPMETLLDGKRIWAEKNLSQM